MSGMSARRTSIHCHIVKRHWRKRGGAGPKYFFKFRRAACDHFRLQVAAAPQEGSAAFNDRERSARFGRCQVVRPSPALCACPRRRRGWRSHQPGPCSERCPIRFRLRYGHQTSTGRHEMLLGANCCEAVHTWVARRGSNLLTVEHIIRANSFPVMSVKAVSRAKASRAASRAILRQNGVRRGVLHPEASPASRAPSWNTSTRAIPIPRSFISTEFVGEILEKVACREKSAGV